MGLGDLKVRLLDADVESQTKARNSVVNEDYVPFPASADGAGVEEGINAPVTAQRKSNSPLIALAICSIAVIIFMGASFHSYYNFGLTTKWKPALEGRDEKTEGLSEFYTASRTSYHFQPDKNWMNDPNAPMFYMGYYHFFYQYNPKGAIWGDIAWGHAVSKDLIHWQHLELALEPDQWYDITGVWSGSATILLDGTPAILYTGARSTFGSDAEQSQSLALPEDPSDPLLRKWKKVTVNPVLLNPDGIRPQDFRDPTTAWLEEDGLWRLVVGAKRDNDDGSKDGISLLYRSTDFRNWVLEDKYLHEVAGTGMWECVDFYPVLVQGRVGVNHSVLLENSTTVTASNPMLQAGLSAENYLENFKYVLKASLDENKHDFYTIGTYSTLTHQFVVDDPANDIGRGPRYDYGKFYASKTFFDTKTSRRILWGWANESDTETDDLTKGWASVQAIPRTVWLDGKTSKNLLQWPVEELDNLRGAKTRHENVLLEPTDVIKVQGGDGSQLDIVVEFEKPDVESANADTSNDSIEFDCTQGGSAHRGVFGPFGLLVLTDEDLKEQTGVFFYISAAKDGTWATRVCSDQSRSSLAPGIDKTVYGSYVTVLPNEDTLSLRILVDHSIVETFVQGGRLAITSRVYPTVAIYSNSHLFLFNNGTTPVRVKSLDVYEMAKVTMDFL